MAVLCRLILGRFRKSAIQKKTAPKIGVVFSKLSNVIVFPFVRHYEIRQYFVADPDVPQLILRCNESSAFALLNFNDFNFSVRRLSA